MEENEQYLKLINKISEDFDLFREIFYLSDLNHIGSADDMQNNLEKINELILKSLPKVKDIGYMPYFANWGS